MDHEGALDAAGRVLTLNTVGPDFTSPGKLANYRDVIELVSDDQRTLASFVEAGSEWKRIMSAHYRRRR